MKLVYNNDYIDLLSRSENDLLASLNGLSKERFYFKPSKKEWSIYECLLHILISEKNITKIIKIESYSTTPLQQKTGMKKIMEYMEYPESYNAPEMTLPNEANIKSLFEAGFSSFEHILKETEEIKKVAMQGKNTAEIMEEKTAEKRSAVKTYDVIFGSKGSRNFKEDKRMYADSYKESYAKKEKAKNGIESKKITNPFTAKYDQQHDLDITSSSASDNDSPEIIEEISSAQITDKVSMGSFNSAYSIMLSSSDVPIRNIKELMTLFISIRDELINYFLLNTDVSLNTFYFAHPDLGDLTKEEWLFYLVSHTNRHRKQIENIKIHLPFTI